MGMVTETTGEAAELSTLLVVVVVVVVEVLITLPEGEQEKREVKESPRGPAAVMGIFNAPREYPGEVQLSDVWGVRRVTGRSAESESPRMRLEAREDRRGYGSNARPADAETPWRAARVDAIVVAVTVGRFDPVLPPTVLVASRERERKVTAVRRAAEKEGVEKEGEPAIIKRDSAVSLVTPMSRLTMGARHVDMVVRTVVRRALSEAEESR